MFFINFIDMDNMRVKNVNSVPPLPYHNGKLSPSILILIDDFQIGFKKSGVRMSFVRLNAYFLGKKRKVQIEGFVLGLTL